MRILLFEDLNYEFNTHTHTSQILSAIALEFYTHTLRFSRDFLVTGTKTHMWEILLVTEFEFNTNTYTSKNRREFEMY